MVDEAMVQAKKEEEDKERKAEELIRKNWPQAKTSKTGVRYAILREGQGGIPSEASRVRLVYTGKPLVGGEAFASTADGTEPIFGAKPEPFAYTIGQTRINPGLDEAIEKMKVGEKRLVIIPANMAYGSRGFLGKERKDEKQFYIPPQATLVYEIEMLNLIH
jgi:peptidylprolyl isomerase